MVGKALAGVFSNEKRETHFTPAHYLTSSIRHKVADDHAGPVCTGDEDLGNGTAGDMAAVSAKMRRWFHSSSVVCSVPVGVL